MPQGHRDGVVLGSAASVCELEPVDFEFSYSSERKGRSDFKGSR
jgi:hypothetical protein